MSNAVGRWLSGAELPAATLTVSTVGTFALGLVTFGDASSGTLPAVGTGACGALTTFSSFSFETVRLWEAGERRSAAASAVGNLLAAALALGLARVLVGGG